MKPVAYKLIRRAGRVELQLDGKKISPVIYRRGPHYPFWTRYANFRDAGIDLCYFFAMFSPPSPTHKMGVAGMFLGKDKYDFSKMDEELRVIHAINPQARVILALCLGVVRLSCYVADLLETERLSSSDLVLLTADKALYELDVLCHCEQPP